MASYDHTKHLLMNYGIFEEGFVVHVAASFVAGFCCAVCSAPVDNIKTRLMNQIGGNTTHHILFFSVSLTEIYDSEFTAVYESFFPLMSMESITTEYILFLKMQ